MNELNMELGDSIDLGGCKRVTIESVIRDLRSKLWLVDTKEHVLFPGDCLACSHFHTEGHRGLLAKEATDLDLKDVSTVCAERARISPKFVDMESSIIEFGKMVDELDLRVIAPIHDPRVCEVNKTMPLVMDGLHFGKEAEMTDQGDLAQPSSVTVEDD
jgi:hypothetical protein